MPGLWADGWFYISSAGLLVSGALFFFLLGQYRAAVAADDASGEEAVAEVPTPATVPVRPVFVPDEPEAAPVRSAAPAPAPSPAAAPAEKKDSLTGQTVTGGVSPAVVYLQNLKVQLEEMGGELKSLAKRVNAISDRDEALIERLAELTAAVEALKSSAPAAAPAEAPAPAPAPKRSRRATDPKPEPVVVVEPAPAPAPAPVEPAAAADPLAGLVAAVPAAEPAPAPVVEPAPVPAAAPSPEPAPTPALTIELGAAPGPGAPVLEPEPQPKPKFSRAAAMAEATLSGGEVAPVVAKAEPAPQAEPSASAEPPAPAEPPAEEKPRRGPVWPV